MSRTRLLIAIVGGHLLFLAVASTNFSIISWLWGDISWHWNYFQYSSMCGFGHAYLSDYNLPQVLCYLVAYGLGITGAVLLCVRPGSLLAGAVALLCVFGIFSFGLEMSHWFWPHHHSWILSAPGALLLLWIGIGIQLRRQERASAAL